MNFVITLRAGLVSLAAAAGLAAPTDFDRRHAVYRDAEGRVWSADQLHPYPDEPAAGRAAPARLARGAR
jgi:hypothetical protein